MQEFLLRWWSHTLLQWGAFLVIGITLGYTGSVLVNSGSEEPSFTEIRSSGKYRFISPLVECENITKVQSKHISLLEHAIQEKISKYKKEGKATEIAYYFRDLNNGPWIGFNIDTPFSPASLIKLPTAIGIYKLAETIPDILTQKVLNPTKDDAHEQNIPPKYLLEAGKEYTVEELIEIMLIYSNNRAYDLLNQNILAQHPGTLEEVYTDLDIALPVQLYADPSANILSVKQYASFFRILYNATYLDSKYSEKILKHLIAAGYDKGIAAGIPKEVGIANKYGERRFINTGEVQLHDCGIVYEEASPYLLCIMTKGERIETLESVIADLASTTQATFSPRQ